MIILEAVGEPQEVSNQQLRSNILTALTHSCEADYVSQSAEIESIIISNYASRRELRHSRMAEKQGLQANHDLRFESDLAARKHTQNPRSQFH